MGYSEVRCHFCGVSFNIGRCRRKDEDRAKAWASEGTGGPGYGLSWVDQNGSGYETECATAKTGCYKVQREEESAQRRQAQPGSSQPLNERLLDADHQAILIDDEMDFDYQPPGDDTLEPLEFASEEGSQSSSSDSTNPTDSVTKDAEEADSVLYERFVRLFNQPHQQRADELLELSSPQIGMDDRGSGFFYATYEMQRWLEHVAGPGCEMDKGYNGNKISVEEMAFCRTAQCLQRKPRNWHSADDDLDFELSSDYFLTGLNDSMPSRDMDVPTVIPGRHSCPRPWADTENYIGSADSVAMPFHPGCFDIFRRMCLARLGQVDVNGLMEWRDELHEKGDDFADVPLDDDVQRSSEQWWSHLRGLEYLAASPVSIPGLDKVFEGCKRSQVPIPDDPSNTSQASPSKHALSAIPLEILLNIADYLDPDSLLSLITADPYLRRLFPPAYFRALTEEHFSSLWECHSSPARSRPHVLTDEQRKPYFWATLTCRDARNWVREVDWDDHDHPVHNVRRDYDEAITRYHTAIEEEMPEILEEWLASFPSFAEELDPSTSWPPPVPSSLQVDQEMVDWPRLFFELWTKTMHKNELKGLRNRERIWRKISWIIDQIEAARIQGTINPLGARRTNPPRIDDQYQSFSRRT